MFVLLPLFTVILLLFTVIATPYGACRPPGDLRVYVFLYKYNVRNFIDLIRAFA